MICSSSGYVKEAIVCGNGQIIVTKERRYQEKCVKIRCYIISPSLEIAQEVMMDDLPSGAEHYDWKDFVDNPIVKYDEFSFLCSCTRNLYLIDLRLGRRKIVSQMTFDRNIRNYFVYADGIIIVTYLGLSTLHICHVNMMERKIKKIVKCENIKCVYTISSKNKRYAYCRERVELLRSYFEKDFRLCLLDLETGEIIRSTSPFKDFIDPHTNDPPQGRNFVSCHPLMESHVDHEDQEFVLIYRIGPIVGVSGIFKHYIFDDFTIKTELPEIGTIMSTSSGNNKMAICANLRTRRYEIYDLQFANDEDDRDRFLENDESDVSDVSEVNFSTDTRIEGFDRIDICHFFFNPKNRLCVIESRMNHRRRGNQSYQLCVYEIAKFDDDGGEIKIFEQKNTLIEQDEHERFEYLQHYLISCDADWIVQEIVQKVTISGIKFICFRSMF